MSPFPPLRMSNDAWGMNSTTGSSGGGSTSLYFNDTMRFGTVGYQYYLLWSELRSWSEYNTLLLQRLGEVWNLVEFFYREEALLWTLIRAAGQQQWFVIPERCSICNRTACWWEGEAHTVRSSLWWLCSTLVSALYDDSVRWAPTSTASVVVIYAWLQHWAINQAQGEFPGGITSIKVLILSRRRVLYALAESSEIGPRPGQSWSCR